ncbi:MAG: hypothetical protein M3072_08190 [Candidatus Dormibacteraeota bacterium]|nr:hypothetical protein [Candidatus Dormibacteraeota bacterium]
MKAPLGGELDVAAVVQDLHAGRSSCSASQPHVRDRYACRRGNAGADPSD